MKSFIQAFAMVAFLFAGSMVAEAQMNYRADVDIPFDFNVGDKSYETGRYTVKINKQMVVGAAALTIQRVGSDEVQTILLGNGGGERSGDVQLIFNSVDGRKYLTDVNTTTSRFELVTERILERRLAESKTKNKGKATEL